MNIDKPEVLFHSQLDLRPLLLFKKLSGARPSCEVIVYATK